MSLKKDNMIKQRSIHSLLIYHYFTAVIIIITMVSLVFYLENAKIMNQADYEFAADQINDVQYILSESPTDWKLLRDTITNKPSHARNGLYRYYIRLIDKNGKVLIQTPNSPNTPSTSPQETSWKTINGSHFLIVQAPAMLGRHKPAGTIQILIDTSYQATKTHARRISTLILIMAGIISILLILIVTRRALFSIHRISNTVSQIGISSLNKRIDIQSLPKELITLGESLNNMLDQIDDAFRRLTQLSADMSHELRTLITNLIGQTEIMLTKNYQPDEYQHALLSNLEELQRISSLFENILFLARAENPGQQLSKSIIETESEINLICEYYEAVLEEKNIKITSSGNATIHANTDMLRRLINNLVSNAVKYTPENGRIHINTVETNNTATISIQDTGFGIESIHLSKIFDRFYRADHSRHTQSSGLGLAIAKSIVDLHQGSIHMKSKVGIGTHVIVTLPK